jgi:hypothetical protein
MYSFCYSTLCHILATFSLRPVGAAEARTHFDVFILIGAFSGAFYTVATETQNDKTFPTGSSHKHARAPCSHTKGGYPCFCLVY